MKKLIYGLIIFGLVAAWVVQQSPTSTLQVLPTLPVFDLESVSQLEIKQQGKITLLAQREGNDWLLSDAGQPTKVKAAVVEQLLLSLQDMNPIRIATKKAENHIRFSVSDSDVSVMLRDSKGKALLHILIGKPATDLRSTYIRLAGEDMVVTVDKILTWQVKRTKDSWLAEEKEAE